MKNVFVLIITVVSLALMLGCQPIQEQEIQRINETIKELPLVLENEQAATTLPALDEIKYGAQVNLALNTQTHRLPWIQRTNNQADEIKISKEITVWLVNISSPENKPVETATVKLDGAALDPWPEMAGYYKKYYVPDSGENSFAPGKHTLEILVNGNLVGTYNFTIVGLTITKPEYGESVSTQGFDLKWTENYPITDDVYRFFSWSALVSDSMCAGHSTIIPDYDNAEEKTIHLAASPDYENINDNAIESGDYAISLEAGQVTLQKADKETIFSFTSVETVTHDVIVGQTNPEYCCNPFEPRC